MLVKSARSVSRELYLEKHMCLHWVYLWLADCVAKILCWAKPVLFTISE